MTDRLRTPLLFLCAVFFSLALITGFGWWRASDNEIPSRELSPTDRAALTEQLIQASPGVYQFPWYAPEIGYTLRPDFHYDDLWADAFTSNELGFRGPIAHKSPDTLRVLFLGDSWTFGMGVSVEAAFPARFAAIANLRQATHERVEAIALALPGYNSFNYLAAMWAHFDRLSPDVVVINLSSNDDQSAGSVLPNGSLYRDTLRTDAFGDPHATAYRYPYLNSTRYRGRWAQVAQSVEDSIQRLKLLDVPVLVHFASRWTTPAAHYVASLGPISAPYVITPERYTVGQWRNPPPELHGTPAAHKIYARIVYRGMTELLGWPLVEDDEPGWMEPVHRAMPVDEGFAGVAGEFEKHSSLVPTSFRLSEAHHRQPAGPFDRRTGRFGGATTIVVRRAAGTRSLRLAVRPLANSQSLYPMILTVRIPHSGGGREVKKLLETASEATIELELPDEIAVGEVMDVVLIANRTRTAVDRLHAESLELVRIWQE